MTEWDRESLGTLYQSISDSQSIDVRYKRIEIKLCGLASIGLHSPMCIKLYSWMHMNLHNQGSVLGG